MALWLYGQFGDGDGPSGSSPNPNQKKKVAIKTCEGESFDGKISQRADKIIARTFLITGGKGCYFAVQHLTDGTWVNETKKTKIKKNKYAVKDYRLPDSWTRSASSRYRVAVFDKKDKIAALSSVLDVTARPVYENGKGYYPIRKDDVKLGSPIDLSLGENGEIIHMNIRAYLAGTKLGVPLAGDFTMRLPHYTADVAAAVHNWKKQHGTEEYGDNNVLDKKTFMAITGVSEKDYKDMTSYAHPIQKGLDYYTSTRSDRIAAMIKTAEEYRSKTHNYIGGSSLKAKEGWGTDCSGFVTQVLFSVGIYPEGTGANPIDHVKIENRYGSELLWRYGKFADVSEPQPGDLVFYSGEGREVCHVALYAGDGMIYDSWPGVGVRKTTVGNGGNFRCYKRIFQ